MISDSMQTYAITQNLNQLQQRMSTLGQAAASGQAMASPADNPQAYTQVLQFQDQQDIETNFNSSATQVQSNLGTYDSVLGSIASTLTQAQQLATEGASTSTTLPDQSAALATQVGDLLQQVLSLANTQSTSGTYIFGGSQNTTQAYTLSADGQSVSYAGDGRAQLTAVDQGASVVSTVPGSDVFGTNPSDPNSVMGALITLQNNLNSGNTAAISQSLSVLQQAQSNVLSVQAEVGAREQQLSNLNNFRQNTLQTIQTSLSNVQDANLPTTITQLTAAQTTYQAALAVAAKMENMPTLANMLSYSG